MRKILLPALLILTILLGITCSAASSTKLSDHDIATLYGPVTSESANVLIQKLHEDGEYSSDKPIYLFIDSPGGEVFAGAKIIDAMKASTRPIYTVDVGLAASMAAWIEEYGVKRYMFPHAVLMFHDASVGYEQDKLSFIGSRVNMVASLVYNFNNDMSQKCKISLNEIMIREDREWWVLSAEAKQRNLVDDVIAMSNYPVPVPEKDKPLSFLLNH